MKKTGFTLAEVLITLTIIGVVATLTLPSLMANTSEQQAITAYKKAINSLSEAGQMNGAKAGFDYTGAKGKLGAKDDTTDEGDVSLGAILNSNLQVDQNASEVLKEKIGECAVGTLYMVFRDGTAVCVGTEATNDYINAWVDTNGKKGPNLKSECTGGDCTTKAKRKIYDQFPVVLYRGNAIPGRWNGIDTLDTTTYKNENAAVMYAMDTAKKIN